MVLVESEIKQWLDLHVAMLASDMVEYFENGLCLSGQFLLFGSLSSYAVGQPLDLLRLLVKKLSILHQELRLHVG